jgi:PAS domain S-box-containing protein
MIDTDVVSVTIDRAAHTVLVVDDNPATRYATSRVLRAAGFKIIEAASGQDALDLGDRTLSAVVLDVHLPDLDGFEVCRRLRAVPATAVVPVIHLSATYVEDRHKVAGLNAGADAYLTHPAEPPILVATVQALVRARLAEDQLRRSQSRFRAIYTLAESGIALIDADGRFLDANPALLRMLGRDEAAVVGQHLRTFTSATSHASVERLLASDAADTVVREQITVQHPDGREIHLEWSSSPHEDPGVRIGIASNISERIQLELQRQELLEREQAARMAAERHGQTKDDFIAVLSHELRNPLNAMLMAVHMLQRRELTAEMGRGLSMIEKNAYAQARIISDILDVSRLNLGKLTLTRAFVDPSGLVRTAIEGMRDAIDRKAVSITVDVSTDIGEVWIDQTRFAQILWNLVSNAIKFSARGGAVLVQLTRRASVMQLIVRDHGEGIDPAFLEHVFNKFSQAVSPERRAHTGLGLGLSIVKHLAELHSGTVRAESKGLGMGATITVELPLLEPSGEHAANESLDELVPMEADIRGVRVLVVEDDLQALEMLSMILRDRGARVTVARDYASAMHAAAQEALDVLVSDIGLPDRDGYDLIRELRRQEGRAGGRPLHAIALTAFGRPEDQAMALASGFDAHIAKPLRPYDLIAAIGRMRDVDSTRDR